ncbi:MAG: hypothetical protein MUC71_03845 [Steroidobacteraceae bacterium]|jgi:hypothetical protein|nr:hypothetical protein [Steroidobacteraceae bacterium]
MNNPATALAALTATLSLLSACGSQGQGSVTLATQAVQPNPAGPASTAVDVAGWGGAAAGPAALYVSGGPSGLDVQRADGSHLQRLGSTPLSRLVVVNGLVVDGVAADFIVAVDPEAGRLRGFEIHAQSGALRRIARSSGGPAGPVTSLCAWRDAEGRHRLVFTTPAPKLEEWEVSAVAGKIPGKANEIVATPLRVSPLGFAAVDCAVDPANGDVYLLDGEGVAYRIAADWQAPAMAQRVWADAGMALRGIEAHRDGGTTHLLATTSDGSLAALAPDGRLLGRVELDVPAGRLAAAGGLLALVAANGQGARIAPLGEALRLVGVGPRPAP